MNLQYKIYKEKPFVLYKMLGEKEKYLLHRFQSGDAFKKKNKIFKIIFPEDAFRLIL